jgi:5'-nucleotidase / UDP-sugar diphosphatase
MLRRRPAYSFVALLAWSCASGSKLRTNDIPPPPAATVTILHFNDVYEITPVAGGRSGGLARVATLRKELLTAHPSLLTTLGGDFVSPSALGTARIDGQALAGRQMVAVLNAVGLDWTTLGNHEFDISADAFRARVAESHFRYVVSNATDSAGRAFAGIVAHAVVPIRAGNRTIRIGLIGLVIDANRVPWVRYADPVESARAQVALLRDSVDAIVALTHLSIAIDQRLAEEVPAIDLILGGHEHENYLLRRGERLTPIIKADANVRTVAVVTLRFAGPGRRPDIASELVRMTDSVREEPGVAAEVGRWVDAAFAGFERDGFKPRDVVATVRGPLDGRESTVRTRSGALSDLIVASMLREAPDAEVALFNGGSIRIDDVIPPGPVTQYDVIRVLPFGGKLVRADISGKLLDRVLRAGRANAGTGGYLHTSGIVWDGETPRFNGQPIVADRMYRVVLTDFLLTGREVNLPFLIRASPDVKVIQDLRDARMALIDELRRAR